MSRQLENTLVSALDLLEQDVPVGQILARYPDMADDLQALLLAATTLDGMAKPSSLAAERASKRQFLQQAVASKEDHRPAVWSWVRQIVAAGLTLLLALFVGGLTLILASNEALPGDTLYGAKLYWEETRLSYSADPNVAAELTETYRQERIAEVVALIALGRREMVVFNGSVEAMTPGEWIVGGIVVAVDDSIFVSEDAGSGSVVRITGMTADGLVVAEYVEVISGRAPEPALVDPAPLATPSPEPAMTPTVQPTNLPQQPDVILPGGSDTAAQTPAPLPSPTLDDQSSQDNGSTSGDRNVPEQGEESGDSDNQPQRAEDSQPDTHNEEDSEASSPEKGDESEGDESEGDESDGGEDGGREEDGGGEDGSDEDNTGEDNGGER